MKKYFKPIIIIALTLILLAGIAYGLKAYNQPIDYTIVDDGIIGNGLIDGVRCQALGPACEYVEVKLKDNRGNIKSYRYYQPEVITTNGETKSTDDLNEGARVKIETESSGSEPKYVRKFILQ
jgi:hypothetical protein